MRSQVLRVACTSGWVLALVACAVTANVAFAADVGSHCTSLLGKALFRRGDYGCGAAIGGTLRDPARVRAGQDGAASCFLSSPRCAAAYPGLHPSRSRCGCRPTWLGRPFPRRGERR